jgi:integration host factor subunit alpha
MGDRSVTMTKADIVERIYEKVGFSKKEASEVVDSVFELIKQHLEQGDKVKVSGFGNFVVHGKQPRKGRNPQTGETITIRGRRVLGFKASPMLKKSMNRPG